MMYPRLAKNDSINQTWVLSYMFNHQIKLKVYIHFTVAEPVSSESTGWEAIGLEGRKKMFLFNDALNTFYLRLYGVGHMV